MSSQSPSSYHILTQMSPVYSKLCHLIDKRWNFIHYFKVTHITFRLEGERYETNKIARKRETITDTDTDFSTVDFKHTSFC